MAREFTPAAVVDVDVSCQATPGTPCDMADVTPADLGGVECWVKCRNCGSELLIDCPPPPYRPHWLSR